MFANNAMEIMSIISVVCLCRSDLCTQAPMHGPKLTFSCTCMYNSRSCYEKWESRSTHTGSFTVPAPRPLFKVSNSHLRIFTIRRPLIQTPPSSFQSIGTVKLTRRVRLVLLPCDYSLGLTLIQLIHLPSRSQTFLRRRFPHSSQFISSHSQVISQRDHCVPISNLSHSA